MKRSHLRILLVVALVVSAGFAAWSWLRPYAWNADPAAGCRIQGAQVKKDLGNYWLDLHLKVNEGRTHDLTKPVRLVTSTGKEHEAADTTLGGDSQKEVGELWFKFWLDAGDFQGPLKLRINDGWLDVRDGSGVPGIGASNLQYFPTHNW